jgi:hypothetical protein
LRFYSILTLSFYVWCGSFSPFRANSGFAFIRANSRTQHFMHQVLLSYDLMQSWASQQFVINQYLTDHMSRHGLRSTVLPMALFPGGAVYHEAYRQDEKAAKGGHTQQAKEHKWSRLIRLIREGKSEGHPVVATASFSSSSMAYRSMNEVNEPPYIFHMCFTRDKPEKIGYLKQAGMWLLKGSCSEKELRRAKVGSGVLPPGGCCASTPSFPTQP